MEGCAEQSTQPAIPARIQAQLLAMASRGCEFWVAMCPTQLLMMLQPGRLQRFSSLCVHAVPPLPAFSHILFCVLASGVFVRMMWMTISPF